MGSSKSKVVPVLSEDEIEEKSSCTKTNVTSCWAGIKNLFSRNTTVVPSEPENDHDDKKNDDDDLVQNSNTAQVTPTTAIVAVEPESPRRHILKAILNELICQNVEPINCQGLKSSPLIGQKGKRPVKRVRPSTSYPADRRVSTWDFLYYHRFVNDDSENESCDEESSDDDEYMDDADIESDVDEIDDRIRVHRFTHRASCKAKVNRGKGGKTKMAKGAFHVSNETRSLIGQRMDMMVEMNDDVSKHTEESSSDYLSSSSLANDVTSDDGASSEVDDVFVEENDFLFMVSLSWITHVNISVAFALLWAFVDIDREMENGMDVFGHDDDGKAVVDRKETGDHTPSGNPADDDYPPDFETDSETDIDQPSTSYKRDKHATYDFIVRKRFMDVSSDEYIW